MAYVVCQRHGGHGAAAVCRHIYRSVLAGEPLGHMAKLNVDYEGSQLGPSGFARHVRAGIADLSEGLLVTGDTGLDLMFTYGWVPICPLCFRDAGGAGLNATDLLSFVPQLQRRKNRPLRSC